mgnify:CR=1 FL=1
MAKFGDFSENGSEFIITDTQTPRPLLNYIWNSQMLSGVNHFGGGEGAYGLRTASYIDPEGRGRSSLIRNGNRYFYIRDQETGEYWNPGWFPAKQKLDRYSCTHGLGYSLLEGAFGGISAKARVFVNQEDPVEIWTVTLTNESLREREIKVYSFVEFSLEGYARYSEYNSYVYCDYLDDDHIIVAHNNAQERPHDWFDGFAASNLKPSGYETGKRAFMGTYGDIGSPESVVRGACSNLLAACEDMVGVLEHTFVLKPEEEITYHTLWGATNSNETATLLTRKLLAPGKIENDFRNLLLEKKRMTDDIAVATPVTKVNHITNMWVKQQVQLCAEVGRATGKGFRDQLQDAWAVAAFLPDLAKEKILETLKYQYRDGKCVRGWLPLDPHIYSDGPVWIAPTVNAYIKETGDYAFLQEQVPYLDEDSGTVWEHILTAVRYSSGDLGERSLVLAHDGDWNDSLNGIGTGGKGESVWTSIALYHALNETAELARYVIEDEVIYQEMLNLAEQIKSAVNANGWDGDWYLAAYNDQGEKVGSHLEQEGSLYLNSQTWAVMSGLAEGERADKCLQAVDEQLDSAYGPLTLSPPYTSYNPSIGRLTGFVPGIWENGTPYCHGGTFKIVADCVAGRGNQAFETYSKILPDSQWNPSDQSGCEPYVFTNMYFGPANPRAGETAFAWVTGTAGWMFRSVAQYMLGFYPGYDSIKIRPCIPEDWEEISMKRVYRGDTYLLMIRNKNRKQCGVERLWVDGIEISGDSFPIFGDGKSHTLLVEM